MKYKVAFVCVHNSCRSQMAEGWAKSLDKNVMDVYSAGTENYPQVKPMAVQVMKEVGIDISSHKPKLLTDIPNDIDIVIKMGCNVNCPYLPSKHTEDWGLIDPSGGTIEDFRKTRDILKDKVEDLARRIASEELVI
ncbi:arsenate reductase [Vallitalea longa]|uniref:Arsenate reductase n=1 Tax=Vallitalea longa TaxID=2936439 RepID=A0A9W6DEG7_9FIRM|nr:arsenate reductase ArsC [Vallitalea longa]GKX27559.1 arsenate reductase [Vallitalea longa]